METQEMGLVQEMKKGIVGNKKEASLIRYWLEELRDAYKREQNWRKDAKRPVAMCECERRKETLCNVLCADTEARSPAL